MARKVNHTPKLTGDAAQVAVAKALEDLKSNLKKYSDIVSEIDALNSANNFRYLSKSRRNELMAGLIERSADLSDASKGAFRVLKKVKRERAPEKLIDTVLARIVVQTEPLGGDVEITAP